MWDGEGEEYCLTENTLFDVSQYLLDDINQNEDSLFCMLEDHTPVKDCIDLHCDEMNIDDDPIKVSEELKETLHLKRRRMLNFSCEPCDTTLDGQNVSAFLKSKARDESLTEDICHANLQQHSGLPDSGKCSFSNEIYDQSSEDWPSNCFETETQSYFNETNEFVASSVEVNSSGFSKIDSSVGRNASQQTSNCRIFRGKKAYMKAPIPLTTSVAYPFTLIKPCGVQGDVTLNDINQRIHAPPPNISKQNAGENAVAAYPTSAFSGKPVVVKTKIRTESGKGSITIVRTKG